MLPFRKLIENLKKFSILTELRKVIGLNQSFNRSRFEIAILKQLIKQIGKQFERLISILTHDLFSSFRHPFHRTEHVIDHVLLFVVRELRIIFSELTGNTFDTGDIKHLILTPLYLIFIITTIIINIQQSSVCFNRPVHLWISDI